MYAVIKVYYDLYGIAETEEVARELANDVVTYWAHDASSIRIMPCTKALFDAALDQSDYTDFDFEIVEGVARLTEEGE